MTDSPKYELVGQYNKSLLAKFRPLARKGVRRFDFIGGRRSGKTYFIMQILLGRMLRGEVVNVATMTAEQGRLGSYQDACDIIAASPDFAKWVEVMKSPREIRNKYNGGRMFFNSYQDAETAKGIACDWLYINEANNFTEKQYIDLSASVRRGVFADRNPNATCWTETNGFTQIHSTWKDNAEHLSAAQLEWFATLKQKAEQEGATAADIAFYKMYYLGEYAEIVGEIFTPANIQRGNPPAGLYSYFVFCDPSALRGADYFACVLAATDGQKVYILDTYSPNTGDRLQVVTRIRNWCVSYDVESVFVETNGVIGIDFYEFASNSELPVRSWYSRGNKFERIVGNYQNIIESVVFADTDNNTDYLKQVYTFSQKCEHDDNIDAVNSVYNAYKWNGLI